MFTLQENKFVAREETLAIPLQIAICKGIAM